MHYRDCPMGSPDSSHSHESWTKKNVQTFYNYTPPQVPMPNTPLHTVSGGTLITNAPYIQTVPLPPVPITNAPRFHTKSLPHPHATPRPSPMTYQHSSTCDPSLMVLHPLLSRGPNVMFNVTRDLAYMRLRPDCSPIRLQEPAVHPPVSHMTITISGSPAWFIEVVNPRGITVNDVLFKIRELLYRSVASHEMRGPPDALAIESFRARSCADPREYAQGMKRIDFLGPKVFFAGLTRNRDGSNSWDLHFSQKV